MNVFNRYSKICLLIVCSIILSISCVKKDPLIKEGDKELKQINFTFENFEREIQSFQSPISTKSNQSTTKFIPHPERSELLMLVDFDDATLKPSFLKKGLTYKDDFNKGTHRNLKFVPALNSISTSKDLNLELSPLISILVHVELGGDVVVDRVEADISVGEGSSRDGYARFYFDDVMNYGEDTLFTLKAENYPYKKMETVEIRVPKRSKPYKKFSIYFNFQELSANSGKDRQYWKHRFDNLKIYGKYNTQPKYKIIGLPYYIFNKKSGELVNKGSLTINNTTRNLMLELPEGTYYSALIYNESNEDLILNKEVKKKDEFFVGTFFQDKHARSFGVLDSFELKHNLEKKITFKRLYSLVTLDFNDFRDLSPIKKVKIKPIGKTYFWTPFNPLLDVPIPSNYRGELEFVQNFNINKEISFNHFLGLTGRELPVNYEIEVWDDTKAFRTFRLSANVKNNVKLIFKGSLYPSGLSNKLYEIIIDEAWAGTKVVEYM